jgi:hypothetical protein
MISERREPKQVLFSLYLIGFVMYFALKGLSESRLSDNANTDHYSRTRSDKRITYADYYSRNNKKEELS